MDKYSIETPSNDRRGGTDGVLARKLTNDSGHSHGR